MNADHVRWTNGNVEQFRVFIAGEPSPVVSFDSATFSRCRAEHPGLTPRQIGAVCSSDGSPIIAVVSTFAGTNPAKEGIAGSDYLGKHGDNLDGGGGNGGAYYAAIGAPLTLGAFKAKYFIGTPETTATYFNDTELGVGRKMTCTKAVSGDIACYVKNYGVDAVTNKPRFAFGDSAVALGDAVADVAVNNAAHHAAFATVAMVFNASKPVGAPNRVQFMAYAGGSNASPLTNQAQLDSTAQHISVPNNCLACHGIEATVQGAHVTSTTGASFLPFNPNSFLFSSAAGFTRAAQEPAFLALNRLVEKTAPPPAVVSFMTSLYGNVALASAVPPSTAPAYPPSWGDTNEHRALYAGVAQPYCLNCHATAVGSLKFATPDDFKSVVVGAACNSHVMPHAEDTLKRFYESGARAYLVEQLHLTNSCLP